MLSRDSHATCFPFQESLFCFKNMKVGLSCVGKFRSFAKEGNVSPTFNYPLQVRLTRQTGMWYGKRP